MDTWATSSLTPQIISAGGAIRSGTAALPDGPAPAGARDHPHLGLLHDRQGVAARAHHPLAAHRDQRLDARPRPQEDVEVEGQRGHAAAPLRRALGRRLALLGGARAAGRRHHVRPRGGPRRQAARDQAAQRQPLRAVAARSRRRRLLARAGRGHHRTSSTSRSSPICAAWWRARPRRSTSSTTRCRCRRPRSCSGASATTTSSW